MSSTAPFPNRILVLTSMLALAAVTGCSSNAATKITAPQASNPAPSALSTPHLLTTPAEFAVATAAALRRKPRTVAPAAPEQQNSTNPIFDTVAVQAAYEAALRCYVQLHSIAPLYQDAKRTRTAFAPGRSCLGDGLWGPLVDQDITLYLTSKTNLGTVKDDKGPVSKAEGQLYSLFGMTAPKAAVTEGSPTPSASPVQIELPEYFDPTRGALSAFTFSKTHVYNSTEGATPVLVATFDVTYTLQGIRHRRPLDFRAVYQNYRYSMIKEHGRWVIYSWYNDKVNVNKV